MKGVRCSWVDMQKIRQALSAGARGDQKALKAMRCVDKSTVSMWQAACDLLDAVDGKVELTQLSSFQPTHAVEIARHFRKEVGKVWDDGVAEKIAEWVDRCEAEGWTVGELRLELRAERVGAMLEDTDWLKDESGEGAQFNKPLEAAAILNWLVFRREKWPAALRPAFVALVRELLDKMEGSYASGGEGHGCPQAGPGETPPRRVPPP